MHNVAAPVPLPGDSLQPLADRRIQKLEEQTVLAASVSASCGPFQFCAYVCTEHCIQ